MTTKSFLPGLILTIFVIAIMSLFSIWRQPSLDAYNRHMCAVYGYYEDCKTPLPKELRLTDVSGNTEAHAGEPMNKGE